MPSSCSHHVLHTTYVPHCSEAIHCHYHLTKPAEYHNYILVDLLYPFGTYVISY